MSLPKPSGEFEWVQESWGPALRCSPLAATARHRFSTRDLPLEDIRAAGQPAWVALARAVGADAATLVRLRQVHGVAVYDAGDHRADVSVPAAFEKWPEADITVSRNDSVALSVRVADCVPVLLSDRRQGAVAAIHAGWRGTAAGAVGVAIDAMRLNYGTDPAAVVAAVGPSIGPCCYEVGRELATHFAVHADAGDWFSSHSRPHLDLWRATRDQLVRAGVPNGQIHVCELCTAHHPELFHSYRRDGARAGRLVAAIRSGPDTRP